MVSIKLVIDGGIVKYAKSAKEEYIVSSEKEQLSLAYQDYSMANISGKRDYTLQNALDTEKANATVIEETNEYWLVRFNETGNQYKLYKNDQKIEKIESGGNPDNPENPQKATLKVGDYVDYPIRDVYASIRRKETGVALGTGDVYGSYHSDIYTKSRGWRVLRIDNDKITLVSATASTPKNTVHGGVIFKREQVYNNGVEILNRICDELYSISGYGKARAMNLEDINKVMGVETSKLETSTLKAEFSAQNAMHQNCYYPIRLEEEQGVEIDSVANSNGLSKSEPGKTLYLNDETINSVSYGSTESNRGLDLGKTYKKFENTLKLQYTNKWCTEANNNIKNITDNTLKELILGKDETRTWWIATRSISQDTWWGNNMADFGMMQMNNGIISGASNYRGQSDSGSNACDNAYGSGNGQLEAWFRPVIELDASVTIDTTKDDKDGDGVTQDGSFEQPWSIIKK